MITEINGLITSTKDLCYKNLSERLNNQLLEAKTYWSILKTFYNDRKIPIIPSLLIDDKFVTDMQMKANIFNKVFSDQFTRMENDSVLPTSRMLLTLNFNEEEIIKIIRNLSVHKTHGHDDISIRMVKICDKSILKPLIL